MRPNRVRNRSYCGYSRNCDCNSRFDGNHSRFCGNRSRKKVVKVIQIGYPGAKRQVNIKALKEVLKATQLDERNGVDSQVFFKGAIPEYKLIEEYRKPLRRLKDK